MKEIPIRFGLQGTLFGILTLPAGLTGVAKRPGIILLNAGALPRLGPARISVELARELAESGFFALRMDFSGLGDSSAHPDRANWTKLARHSQEILDGMDMLARLHGVDDFVLLGICAGADMALSVGISDRRIKGMVLINGRFMQRETFQTLKPRVLRMAMGRFRARKVRSVYAWPGRLWRFLTKSRKALAPAPRIAAESTARDPEIGQPIWARLKESGVRTYLIFSELSMNLDLFRLAHEGAFRDNGCGCQAKFEVIPGADHSFISLAAKERLKEKVRAWCSRTAIA